jgi:hypothetical protein
MPMLPVIELIEADLAAQRIAVNPEQARGARLVAARSIQYTLDEFLLEFVHGFVEMNSTLHHLPDQGFQLILHCRTLRTRIVRSRMVRLAQSDLVELVAR